MKLKGEIEIILCFFILVGFLSAIVPSSLSSANEINSFSNTFDSFNGESFYVKGINSYNVSSGKVISTNYKDSFNREDFIPGSYIIQLESPSIIEKHSSLKKEKYEELQNSIYVSGQTRGDSSFQILSNEIDEEINETIDKYSEEIAVLQKNVLLEIESEIFKEDSEGFFEGATDFINFFSLSLTGKAIFSSESSINPSAVFQNVLNGFTLENLTQEQALAIENLDSVKKVYPNKKVYATLSESVPLIQDGVLAGQLDRNGNDCLVSGEECLTGKGIKIAIIDTGVDYTHSDLGGCTTEEFLAEECEKVIGGYDFVTCESWDTDGECVLSRLSDDDPFDDMGHGTHCAAIAAGNGTLKGVAPGAGIFAYKVLNSRGEGSNEWVISGIEKAVEEGADILSLSLSSQGNPDDAVSQAVDNAVLAGKVVVVAAGNSGPYERTIGSPGTAREAITVGASDKNDVIANFSSRGLVIWTDENGNSQTMIKPDITAPGVNVCAAQWDSAWSNRQCLDDEHTSISGTSMATPIVSGSVAIIKQAHPDWIPEEIKASLKATAIDIGESTTVQGAGRINLSGAVELNEPAEMFWDFLINLENEVNNVYDKVIIKGIFPSDYDSLVVEWKKSGEETWKTEGVSIIGRNGIIAEFEPEVLISETGDYKFRAVINRGGIEKESIVGVWFDKDLKRRWKNIFSSSDCPLNYESPIILDINQDGKNELIVSGGESVYISDSEGNLLTEIFVKDRLDGKTERITSIAISDLNYDKNYELVVLTYHIISNDPLLKENVLYVFDSEGKLVEGWPRVFGDSDSLASLLILNKDNYKNILVGNCDGKIYSFNFDGSYVTGFPVSTDTVYGSSVFCKGVGSVFALSNNFFGVTTNDEKKAYLYNFDGEQIEGWPQDLPYYTNNYPSASGDLDGDGIPEIIILLSYPAGIQVFNQDGTLIWGRSFSEFSMIQNSLALSDLDSNGDLEIILAGNTFYNSIPGGKIYVLDKDGNIFNGWPKSINYFPLNSIVSGNFLGDDKKEIVFFSNDFFYMWNFDGSFANNYPKKIGNSYLFSSPSIGDLDNDGLLEVVKVGGVYLNYFIYVYDLDASYNSSIMDWPMFQHDPQHTGCYDCAQTKYLISHLNYLSDWELNEDNNISIILNNQFEESKSVNYSLSYSKCNYSNRLNCIYLQITEGNKEFSPGETFKENVSFSFSETGEYILMLDLVGDEEATYYYSLNVFDEENPIEEDPYEKSSILEGYFLDSKFFADIPSNITFEITNYGNVKTENASYYLYYQKDRCYINYEYLPCDNLSLLAFEEIELKSGKGISIQKEISLEAGEYTFILILNSSNQLGKIYPAYDFIKVNPPGPDLNVNVVGIDYGDNIFVGDEKEFSLYVENVGTEKSKDIVLEMYDYYSNKILLKSFNLGNLNPGENVSVKTSYTFDKKGDYYFLFELKSKEDVNFDNDYEYLYLRAIVDGVDVGIKEENVYVSFSDYNFENFIRGSLGNFGSQVILEEDANLSFFIDDSFIDSEIFSFESSSEGFSFDIPKEFYGKNVSVNLTLFMQGDVDLTDNFFRKDFLIPNFLNVSFLVKNSSGNYADRYLVDSLNEAFYSTLFGAVNITVVEQQGSLAIVFSDTPFDFSSDSYQAAIFEESFFDNSEEIITDRYEKISEENKDYYLVHTFNTSFNYSSFAFYYQEKNEKLESLIGEETPDMFQIVYCTNFDILNKKCTLGWELFEKIYFEFDESNFLLSGHLKNFSVEAVGLTLKENLKGTDEKSISNGISKEYKKYNSYGEISFNEEVNVSRIKNNQKLLENIQIGPRKIFINESNLPELVNKNATITFRGIHFNNPKVIKNGGVCSGCSNIIYNLENFTLSLDVAGFSEYSVVEGPYCGDSVCQSNENKNNCPSDCSSTGGTGGGSGGSGGGSTSSSNSLVCIPNWNCSWGECINKIRTENCVDLNFCQTLVNKPEEKTEVCFIENSLNFEKVINSESSELEEPSNNFYLILLIIVFIFSIFFILLFIFLIFFNKKDNLKKNKSFSEAQLKMKNLLEQGNYFIANGMKTEALKIYIEIKNLYSTSNEFKNFYEEILSFYSNLNRLA